MKSLMYAIVYVALLLGTALAHLHLPKGELELRTYPNVSATEFAVTREDALRLAAGNAELDFGLSGNSYFELNCRSEPTLLVDNSSSQLLTIGLTSRAHKTLYAQPLLLRWSSRLVPDQRVGGSGRKRCSASANRYFGRNQPIRSGPGF
jgi:hypothetical protein